jgi:hypothetical protein
LYQATLNDYVESYHERVGLAERAASQRAEVTQRRWKKLRIMTFGAFGWEIAHEAVSRRPPISLYTIVPRTEG